MSAVVGEKSLVILLSIGVHSGLTLGPVRCLFMGGLLMEMAACSRRFSWCLSATVERMVVLLQYIVCCMSWLCLAGADFMLPIESVKLLSR